MTDFDCQPLTKQHDRRRFQCGESELDHWLQHQARQDQDRQVAVVYVASPKSDPSRIAGFYTLSATSIHLTGLPDSLRRKLPRYPAVPAVLIGRLARDLAFSGLGGTLLADALDRANRYSSQIAAVAVVVDAKNEQARSFYKRHGFLDLTDSPHRLFLPIETIQKASKSRAE